MFCDCPHEAEVCKHVVAVLYAVKEQLKTVKIKPAKKAKKFTFADLVEKATRPELQAFVQAYAISDKKFKAQFELHFAHKDERIDLKQKYTDLVKKMIRSHTSHGFVDYHATNALSREMDAILSKASEAINTDNFKDGLTIVEVILQQLLTQVVPNSDDSSGKLGDTITEAIELLGTLAESDLCSRELKEYLFTFLDTELSNGTYFDYGDYGYNLFEVYRNLAVMLFNEKEFFLFLDRKVEQRGSSRYNEYRSEFFIQQKILFYQETGNEKKAENLALENLGIVEIRQSLVQKAIDRKDYVSAKRLINEGIQIAEKKPHPGTVSEWKKVLLKIAELEGDVARVRYYTAGFAFNHGFSPFYYQQWKKTFTKETWEKEYSQLIEQRIIQVKALANKNKANRWWSEEYNLLLILAPIYVEEKQWNELFALVKGFPQLNVLLQYLPQLASDFPGEMTALFIPAFIQSGDEGSSRSNYAQLVSNMKKVLKAIPESREKIFKAAESLKLKYPRRPAMLDELNKLM